MGKFGAEVLQREACFLGKCCGNKKAAAIQPSLRPCHQTVVSGSTDLRDSYPTAGISCTLSGPRRARTKTLFTWGLWMTRRAHIVFASWILLTTQTLLPSPVERTRGSHHSERLCLSFAGDKTKIRG
jgi:hypothetical protein